MAVIEKNCDGSPEPNCRYDQVNGVIAVHIARRNFQAARRSHNQNRLPFRRAQPKSNPVVGQRNRTAADANVRQIGAQVTIEVRNCKCQPTSG